MVDMHELARRFNSPDPEVRQTMERDLARLAEMRAQGLIAPPSSVERQDFAIGLDADFNPILPIIYPPAPTDPQQVTRDA